MTFTTVLLVLVVLALCTAPGTFAFGAGEIPDVSAMAKIGGDIHISLYRCIHVLYVHSAC